MFRLSPGGKVGVFTVSRGGVLVWIGGVGCV